MLEPNRKAVRVEKGADADQEDAADDADDDADGDVHVVAAIAVVLSLS
jgi:hypothetical protein